jgi:hypothetical protein
MDDKLRAAFRATLYRFDSPGGELLLRVDAPNAALARFLSDNHADSMAVLTAFNPQAQQQDIAANCASQDLLRRDLAAVGYSLVTGRHEDPAGRWPVEESFLVLGINLQAARSFAARYGQLAFLWTDASAATPRLVETIAPE